MRRDLRPWLLDAERRHALTSIWKEQKEFHFPDHILKEMEVEGLLEILPERGKVLTKKGRLLAYNLAELEIQVDNRKLLPVIEKLNVFQGSVVLDVGCGGGQSLFAIADKGPSLALGMDPDRDHLEIAKSFALNFPLSDGKFAFQQADGNYLPLRDASVDFLICRGSLHYLNIYQALHEMTRVLKPGGRIFIHALGVRSFAKQALKSDLTGKLFGLFGLLNGIFHFLTGRQIVMKYKKHLVRVAFLSRKSLMALERSGITIKHFEQVPEKFLADYYVVLGKKS